MRVIPTMSSSMLQKNLIYLSLSLQIRGKETLRSLNANIFSYVDSNSCKSASFHRHSWKFLC